MTGSQLLRRYLRDTGETLAGLARRTGLDDGYLSRLLNGTRYAGLSAGTKIERATGGRVPATSWLKGRTGKAA